jgi:hypothetical protein
LPGAPCKYLMFRFRLIFIALSVRADYIHIYMCEPGLLRSEQASEREREKFNISIGAEQSAVRNSLASPTPRAGIFDIKPRCAANRAHAPRQRFHWMWWPRPLLSRPELSERDADAACRVERRSRRPAAGAGPICETERADSSCKKGVLSVAC